MKIYNSSAKDLWSAAEMDAKKAPVISVVGAGGKTSLIYHLSCELNRRKIPHYILTTTHMWPMDGGMYGEQIGTVDNNGKIGPVCEEVWKKILSDGSPVLIEADGSKRLPCKVPEVWEPVLRKETTHVFGVLGMSCLGKSIMESCHRQKRVAQLLNCSQTHCIQTKDVLKIIKSPEGLRKHVDPSWKYHVVLNQVDDEKIYDEIKWIEEAVAEEIIDGLWFTKLLEQTENNDNGDIR